MQTPLSQVQPDQNLATMAETKKSVQTFYEQVNYGNWHIENRLSLARKIWGKKVLDAGCGAGNGFFNYILNGAQVTGVDMNATSVRFINEKCKELLLPGQAIQADLTNLPLPDKNFDFIFCRGVLHHMPDAPLAVKEFCRILKDDGEIEIVVYHKHSLENYRRIFISWLMKYAYFLRPLLFPGPDFADKFENPYWTTYTRSTLKSLCEQANLNVVSIEVQGPVIVGKHLWDDFIPPIVTRILKKWLYPTVGWNLAVTCRKQSVKFGAQA